MVHGENKSAFLVTISASFFLACIGCSDTSIPDVPAPAASGFHVGSKEDAELLLETFKGKVIDGPDGQILQVSGSTMTDDQLQFAWFYPDAIRIYAGHNLFKGNGLQYLAKCKKLEELFLEDNAIEDVGLSHLAQLTSLKKLNLSRTKVTSSGCADLGSLTRLESLLLDDTQVDDKAVGHFAKMTSLQEVSLAGTAISRDGVAELVKLPSLIRIYLARTNLTDDVVPLIASAKPNLKVLDLSGTKITDKALSELTAIGSLWNLTIADTQITDAGIEAIAEFPVTIVDIRGTEVTPAAAASFAKLPKLTSIYADQQLVDSPEFQQLRSDHSLRIKPK